MKRLMLTASELAWLSMPHSALACFICRCGAVFNVGLKYLPIKATP